VEPARKHNLSFSVHWTYKRGRSQRFLIKCLILPQLSHKYSDLGQSIIKALLVVTSRVYKVSINPIQNPSNKSRIPLHVTISYLFIYRDNDSFNSKDPRMRNDTMIINISWERLRKEATVFYFRELIRLSEAEATHQYSVRMKRFWPNSKWIRYEC
jgi:hypothetical protein